MRLFLFIIGIFAILLPLQARSAVDERYASIVVVERTGEVLHARYADQLRHPASLTKVMTLYLLFDAIERGNVGLDDHLRISANAVKAKPSKLGLKKDTTIAVEDAIRALVTKSANDVAIVIAERLSGGEAKFAGKMTKTAKLLGMTRTRFGNSSGLPDRRQTTTARDMAILAAAIRHDFPKYFHYFSLEKFVFDGKTYGNHNSLVGRVDGVDGLKTGYTNSSGYNIVVTTERDGERVIVVVFGGATATQRDSHAHDLITAAFTEIKRRKAFLAETTAFAKVQAPIATPIVPPAGLPDQIEQGATSKRGVQIIIEGQEPAQHTDNALTGKAEQWLIQVGAYSLRTQAEARLQNVSALSLPALSTASPIIESTTRNGKSLFRARFSGLAQKTATRACLSLTRRGEPCFPLASAK